MFVKKSQTRLGLFTLIAVLHSAPLQAIDLVEVYERALNEDATFASAKQILAAAKLDLPLAKSAFGPLVTVSGGMTLNYNNARQEGSSNTSYSNVHTQFGLNADKKLIDTAVGLDIESARVAEESAFLTYSVAQQALIQRSIVRYLDVLSSMDNQQLAQREKEAIAKQLDLSTQRLEVGLGTKTDQYDAIARYEQTKATLISAQNSVVDDIQNLEELLGTADTLSSDDFRVLSSNKIQYEVDDSEQWLQDSITNNKAHQLAQMRLTAAQLDFEKTQKLKSFSVDVAGSWGLSDNSSSADGFGNRGDSWAIGLSARYPLFQAGTVKLKQEQAGHRLNSAKSQLEQARRETGRLIRTAQRAVQSNDRQVEALGQAVIASESALISKQEGFRAGVTTNLDVLDGQRDLFRAQRDYLRSRYDSINAMVDLELASGGLTAEDLSTINSWLERI